MKGVAVATQIRVKKTVRTCACGHFAVQDTDIVENARKVRHNCGVCRRNRFSESQLQIPNMCPNGNGHASALYLRRSFNPMI
jgi:hypothetical protein